MKMLYISRKLKIISASHLKGNTFEVIILYRHRIQKVGRRTVLLYNVYMPYVFCNIHLIQNAMKLSKAIKQTLCLNAIKTIEF